MIIPFIDLFAQYHSIKKEVDSAIQKVINSSDFIQGEEVDKFEIEFADYLNIKNCITLNSGTDALTIGLRALDLSPGDEIIIPTYNFIAAAVAAIENRLKPVFVDVDPHDFGLNLEDLEKKINPRTKAIIVVHLFGQPDKISEIRQVIKKSGRKIYLIEDACQAHGAKYKGRKVGSFGNFSVFSFYPTKNLGAFGDGGAILTNDTILARKFRLIKQYGQKKRYFSEIFGINSRLDSIQAAVLRVKLKHLDKWNSKRILLANLYFKYFAESKIQIKTPRVFKERKSVYHLFVIRASKRDELKEFLDRKGIKSMVHYPQSLHQQKVYKYLGYKKGDFPNAEKITKQNLSIPIYPELKKQKIRQIVDEINSFYYSRIPL